jgi:hypothetical protein
MGIANQRTLIEQELITEMQLLYPGMVLLGENADIPPPSNEPWIRMSITVLDIIYPCLGQLSEETDALFNVQLFVPLGTGAGEASTRIDAARSILKSSALSGIEFLTFDVATGVVESDWYVLLLRAQYRARE